MIKFIMRIREILKRGKQKEAKMTITVNGTEYVKKDRYTGAYFLVRTESAGVFAGRIASRSGDEVMMENARRMWYWEGAASLSELSVKGTSKPAECKFPCEVDSVLLIGVIEILTCTDESRESIQNVPIWTAH